MEPKSQQGTSQDGSGRLEQSRLTRGVRLLMFSSAELSQSSGDACLCNRRFGGCPVLNCILHHQGHLMGALLRRRDRIPVVVFPQ